MSATHNGHAASCLCCIQLYVRDEECGYSEYTPGSPACIDCQKGHFKGDIYDVTLLFQELHDKAQTCKDFEIKDGIS